MLRSTWMTAVVAIIVSVTNATTATTHKLITCLQNIKSGSKSYLVTPSTGDYAKDRYGFNYAFDFKPSAIYHAASNADAAAAIKCAAASKVAVAPRSGGHSYEGYSIGGRDGALVIDLNLLQHFAVNKETRVATIGAGSRLGPIYANLWKAGKYLIPAGTCPTVGVGGHALGGGIGLTTRKYGVLADNVIGMTFIDSTGTVNMVSKSSNQDLFWALRGAGGGSFGLVTEFQIQAYNAPSVLTHVSIEWPLSNYSAVLDAYGAWARTATDDIMVLVHMRSTLITFTGVYLGTQAGAHAAVAGMLASAPQPPIPAKFEETGWYEEATRLADLKNGTLESPVTNDLHYARGRSLVYRKPLSTEEKDTIYKYLSNPPKVGSASLIIIDIWGGKVDRPDVPSAFDSHRGVLYGIQFIADWADSESPPGLRPCDDCLKWSADFVRDMQKAYHSSGGSLEGYQNYIERDMPNYLDAYYGNSLPRLKTIKKAVDPGNLFRFPQGIPVSDGRSVRVEMEDRRYELF
ncbi:hypothetical protein QQS21_007825 [Conoideocrella luteorostrata]|uniref:FAD-binding PCMH-type domain-containing protein n=1 Tax=Conoideocrella luteorostrata TaxID=1105319 RepID=A0AAJ0FX25_9HYPO|nr:hypothetical protein QQS21_007825 [Conoideocrella luteorostrata]